MKKHFLNILFWFLLLINFVAFDSCTKKEDTNPSPSQEDTNSSLDGVISDENSEDLGSGISSNLEYSYRLVLSTSSYTHFYQKNALSCGSDVCLPTAYMIGKKMIYPNSLVNATELDRIKNGMGTVCSGSNRGTSITRAYNFAKNDIGTCQPKNEASTNREISKTSIQNYLSKGLPVIALVRINQRATITTSGTYNHFVLIVGLDYTKGGTGSVVYYIDPLSEKAVIKQADYSKFLDAMKAASSFSAYNLMAVGCEKDVKQVDITTGLVLYLPFNGNAQDASGNANHGTVNGATLTTDRKGNANSAYSFDGINDNIVTNFLPSKIFSISMWFNPENNQVYNSGLFSTYEGFNFNGCYISFRGGKINIWTDGNNYDLFDLQGYDIWQHLVVTSSGTSVNAYINGKLIYSKNALTNHSGVIFFGDSKYDSRFFKGKLDEIRIYNRALSESEIQKLYQQ